MDQDATGADISLDAVNLSPGSGLDPGRLVRAVPTAAQSVFPENTSTILVPVSTTMQPRGAEQKPIAAEAHGKPVDLRPQDPIVLSHPGGVAPVIPQGSIAVPVQGGQQGQAPSGPFEQRAQMAPPNQKGTPGIGEGMFGSNRTVVPAYDVNENPLITQRKILEGQRDELQAKARSPWLQFWNHADTKEWGKEAAELSGKIADIDRQLQGQKDNQHKADNAGVPRGQQSATQTNDTIVENLVKRMKDGNQDAYDALVARGHKDLAETYQPYMITSMETKLQKGMQIKELLDSAKTDAAYNSIRKELDAGGHKLSDATFDIPKSLGEWEKQRAQRDENGRRAQVAINRYNTQRIAQTTYTPQTDKNKAEVQVARQTMADGSPMPGVKAVVHQGSGVEGNVDVKGSDNLRKFGAEKGVEGAWNRFGAAQQKTITEETNAAVPQAEREKLISFLRTHNLATTDPKTGLPMTTEQSMKLINTNPNVKQAIAEGFAAAMRGGAGGANGQLMKIELANRGPVQNALDAAITAWAGGKGVVTGKEAAYLSQLTQGQIRYVLDFLRDYNMKDVGERLKGVAARAGSYGARLDQIGWEKELTENPVIKAAHAYGRDKEKLRLSEIPAIVRTESGDRIYLDNGPAGRAVAGATVNPLPLSALPGLTPELHLDPHAPPAAPNAPGGGSRPPPGGTPPPIPGGGPVRPAPTPVGGGPVAPQPYNPRLGHYGNAPTAPAGGGPAPVAPAPVAPQPAGGAGGPVPVQPAGPGGGPVAPQPAGGPPAPVAPQPVRAVPTPQQPGGPGTGVTPPAAPAPSGGRPGGTFNQGTPSGGFPANINGNPVARTVYGIAGQTAQNVSNNPVIANNSAIVTTSSAQSESAFNPDTLHDNKTGYGLFGHRLDRLTAMHKFAGTQPGQPIPANVQASFFVREMSQAADSDPFIARVLSNPNATAEDLTRVQMRMERPQGYKGPGTEEQGMHWDKRLANTRALMGAAVASGSVPQQQTAQLPYPNARSPQEARANYAAGQRLTPEEAAASQQRREELQRQTTVSAARLAKPVLTAGGAVGGTLAGGPVGGAAGAAAGGAAGGAIEEYFTAPQESRNIPAAAGKGVVEAIPAMIPGGGVVATGARIATSGAIPGIFKYAETGDVGEAAWTAAVHAAGGALGESVGRGLGMAGHKIWGGYNEATKAELIAAGKILSEKQPKTMGPGGKMVDDPIYTKAAERAKELGQDPDALAYAYRTADKTGGKIPPSKGEALTQRPGQVEAAKVGHELDDIKAKVGEAPKPNIANAPQFKHDPEALVGTGRVPEEFRKDAITAKNTMINGLDGKTPAKNWGEAWENQSDARTVLLRKEREAIGTNDEAAKAYRAMADEVRKQQQHIAEKLLPPDQAKALIKHLEVSDDRYRKAMLAGGKDIVKVIAKGGDKGREAQAAFNELVGDDVAAKRMMSALLKLHSPAKTGAKAAGWASVVGATGLYIPGVGPYIATGLGAVKGWQLMQDLILAKGASKTVTFADLVKREMSKQTKTQAGRAGSIVGAGALPVASDAIGAEASP